MFLQYWGLKEKAFENTADPRFLYLSEQHQEALSRLLYAITENKGAVMLTGVFGCGKTVLANALSAHLSSSQYQIALITNPQLSNVELLKEILYKLGVKERLPDSKSDILHTLNEILVNSADDGKNTVVIIDEAHLIEDRLIFEELRLLLNLQYKNRFLITLVLSGQPELKEKINHLRQFQQRIAMKYHIAGLKEEEISTYIKHRLDVAGCDGKKKIFEENTHGSLFNFSGGIPRRINQICDLAMMIGYVQTLPSISAAVIEDVGKDLES